MGSGRMGSGRPPASSERPRSPSVVVPAQQQQIEVQPSPAIRDRGGKNMMLVPPRASSRSPRLTYSDTSARRILNIIEFLSGRAAIKRSGSCSGPPCPAQSQLLSPIRLKCLSKQLRAPGRRLALHRALRRMQCPVNLKRRRAPLNCTAGRVQMQHHL